ncbi:MAG: hypothetical protein JO247_07040 [Chloroflexi bacterium]|nr:hypothetical protein [Chloroflexota bacterium]
MRTTTTGQTISCEAAGCSEPVAVKLHTVPLCARHAAECLLPDTGHVSCLTLTADAVRAAVSGSASELSG